MAVFVVSYDLTRPKTEDYKELWAALDALGSKRVLYSQYAVKFNGTAVQLANSLWTHMDGNDRLLVMARDSGDWASIREYTDLNTVK